jgi:hypothetical protein
LNPNALSQSYQQQNAQSQAMTNQDLSNASNYTNQYNTDVGQSQAAQQGVQNQIQYMQGAGSGQNVYNQELGQLTSQHDPNIQGQLSGANASLFGLTGALNGANQSFNQPGGVGAYGLSSAALGGYENSVLNPLQQGVSNANTQVNALNSQLGTLMTGANQATTSNVQTEQSSLTGLQSQYTNALAQQAQAQSNMQFYSQLASTQQGLTASQAAAYAQAQAAFQTSSAAMQTAEGAYAQAMSQAKLNQQAFANTAALNAKAANQPGGTAGNMSTSNPNINNQAGTGAGNGSSNNYVAPGVGVGSGANTINMNNAPVQQPSILQKYIEPNVRNNPVSTILASLNRNFNI